MSEFQAKTSLLSLLKEEDNLVDKYNTLVEHIDDLKQYIEDIKTLLDMSEDLKISLITRNQIELGKQESEVCTLINQIDLIRFEIKKRFK